MTSAFLLISLKTNRGISARFSKMPERCVAARCGNIKDEANGISMHRIPFIPERLRRRTEMDRFYAGAEEDGGKMWTRAWKDLVLVLDALQ